MRLLLSKNSAYGIILLLTALRVVTSKVKACPLYFDCESYLAMLTSISYDSSIPGHHAMRVFPVLLARFFQSLGFDATTSFQWVSGIGYCTLGVLLYYVFRRLERDRVTAFAFTLLCLAPHHAMRIPLQLVYQSCDMLTYPLTLLMIYFSLRKNMTALCIVGLIGIATRQNLFILAEVCLLYGFVVQNPPRFALPPFSKGVRVVETMVYMVLLAVGYGTLQTYFHGSGVIGQLLTPPPGYFSPEHLWSVMMESNLITLFVPMLPFVLFSCKSLIQFFKRYWHFGLYMAIVIGQPFLGFHMTGNNFERLALQGVWIIFIACALVQPSTSSKRQSVALVLYGLSIYFVWGMTQRIAIASLYTMFLFFSWLHPRMLLKQTSVGGVVK